MRKTVPAPAVRKRKTMFEVAGLDEPTALQPRVIESVDYSKLLAHTADVDGARIEFSNCKFDYCVFERTYFRRSIFNKCSFVGARLVDCNFRKAKFSECKFDYVTLRGTSVEWDAIVKESPDSLGIRQLFYRELRNNAVSLGEMRPANSFIKNEMGSHRKYLWAAWSYRSTSRLEKLSPHDRAHFDEEYGNFFERVGAFLNGLPLGYLAFFGVTVSHLFAYRYLPSQR